MNAFDEEIHLESDIEMAALFVRDVWIVQGPDPRYHQKAQNDLRQRWPRLAHALELLATTIKDNP